MVASSLLAAPWATTADLPTGAHAPAAPIAPATWDDVLLAASEALFLLTGQQWRGSSQTKVQVLPEGYGSWCSPLPGWVPLPVVLPSPAWGGWFGWGRQLVVVSLPSSPVTSIDTVTIDGVTVATSAYYCSPAGLLERTDGQSWPVDGSLLVTYTHGSAPPAAGKQAAVSLAIELAKVTPGSPVGSSRISNANLISQVTREGVGVTYANVRDAISGGITGIPEVDLFLQFYNPQKMRRRASAWSPDHGRTRKRTA